MSEKLTKRAVMQVRDDLECCTKNKCIRCSLAPLAGDACKDRLMDLASDAINTVLGRFPPEIGSKAIFINALAHELDPDYAPPVGTIGTVQRILKNGDMVVQWPAGTTRGDGIWRCPRESVEEVYDDAES